ncbi:MAG: hypothetical protein ABI854_11750, partial [Betaproteobacteria bacterium]
FDFALLGTGERPKRFSATSGNPQPATPVPAPALAAPVAPPARADAPARETPAAIETFTATHTLKRGVPVYDEATARRKSTCRLIKDTPVRIESHAELSVNNRQVEWVKVVTGAGAGGWLQASELTEIK